MNQEKTGIQAKYLISHRDGSPVDQNAFYWVLRIDGGGDPKHIAACRKAWCVYANEIRPHLPLLAEDIYQMLKFYEGLDNINDLSKKLVTLTEETKKNFPVKCGLGNFTSPNPLTEEEMLKVINGPIRHAQPKLLEELAKPLEEDSQSV